MEKPKKHFLFNLEWEEILSELPQEVKYEVYDAIIEYAKSGKLLDLKPIAKGCFLFIRKELDYYKAQYQNTINARKKAGSKGGKSKQMQANEANQANASFANKRKQTQAYMNMIMILIMIQNINLLHPPIPPRGIRW